MSNKFQFPTYLAFSSLRATAQTLLNNRVHPRYVGKAVIIALSALVVLPFNLIERFLFNRKIKAIKLDDQPLCILGNDRSGTTHLMTYPSFSLGLILDSIVFQHRMGLEREIKLSNPKSANGQE